MKDMSTSKNDVLCILFCTMMAFILILNSHFGNAVHLHCYVVGHHIEPWTEQLAMFMYNIATVVPLVEWHGTCTL